MAITDIYYNPIDPSSVSFYSLKITEAPEFPHDIYSFLIQSVREADQKYGDELVLRWLASAQSEFEDTYERILSLLDVVDPEFAPEDALQYLKWIVGFTSKLDDVTGGLSTVELRRLISIAARTWKYKGTEYGLKETLEAISSRSVRILNWFFFRALVDEVELGREELDVDFWLLDQPGMTPSVLPDSVTRSGPIAEMDVLPSVDSPTWTYVVEGHVTEGDVFSISSGRLVQTQDDSDELGGRYTLEDPPNVATGDAQVGIVWCAVTVTSTGTRRPWHLLICDGVRQYVLTWSLTEVALEDTSGAILWGPNSYGFSVGTSYNFRLYKDGASAIRASVDGLDLFGSVSATLFPTSSTPRYGFGYLNLGEVQNWIVNWDDAGGIPELNFDLTTLLGSGEAVPHSIRVKYIPSNVSEVVESFWSGSENRCVVTDGFGLSVPIVYSSTNDFRVAVDPDEFVSDIRIVDEGSLNRDLVTNLVDLLRPSGERYFVRFLDFADTFRRPFDWIVVSGTATPDVDAGRVYLEHASQVTSIKTDYPNDSAWTEPQVTVQFSIRDVDSGKWGEVRFCYSDEDNFYALRIDPSTRVLSLDRVTTSTRTTLDSVTLDVWWPDTFYHFHVQTENVGSSLLMKYFLDGNLKGEATDSDHLTGKLAVATGIGQNLCLTFTELYVAPLTSVRVGPN